VNVCVYSIALTFRAISMADTDAIKINARINSILRQKHRIMYMSLARLVHVTRICRQ